MSSISVLLLIKNQVCQYMKGTKEFVQKAPLKMSGQFLVINMQLRHFPSGHLNPELLAEKAEGGSSMRHKIQDAPKIK